MSFLNKWFLSFKFASQGFVYAFKGEKNFRFHCLVLFVVIPAGIFANPGLTGWIFIALAITLVLLTELLNSAIERISNFAAGNEKHELIGQAKDMAAAAVLLAAVFAVFIGIVFIVLPIWKRLMASV